MDILLHTSARTSSSRISGRRSVLLRLKLSSERRRCSKGACLGYDDSCTIVSSELWIYLLMTSFSNVRP